MRESCLVCTYVNDEWEFAKRVRRQVRRTVRNQMVHPEYPHVEAGSISYGNRVIAVYRRIGDTTAWTSLLDEVAWRRNRCQSVSQSDETEDLELLRRRLLSLMADVRGRWREYCVQGQGNSEEAQLLWDLRTTLEHLAQTIQIALEGEGLDWLLQECAVQIQSALRELDPDWADGKPLWWLWACRKEAAFYRLTRRVVRRMVECQGSTSQSCVGIGGTASGKKEES